MMQTAIITGASGNMGNAVVKKFLATGYHVVGTIVPNDPVPLQMNSTHFEKIAIDLGNEDDVAGFIGGIIEKYSRVDVLVATVGGFANGSVAETGTSDILKQYKLNFETAYNVARPVFIQMMKQRSGRIFLVGSRPGLEAKRGQGMVAYSLAKSMIFRLAELMNDEAEGLNVITNVLVPGTIDTPQNRKSMPGADFNSWVTPEAIADTIHLYALDEAASLPEHIIKLY